MLKRFEAEALAQFDHIVTVTDEDRLTLQSLLEPGKRPPFTTIPICVDTAEVQPVKPAETAKDVLHLGRCSGRPMWRGCYGSPERCGHASRRRCRRRDSRLSEEPSPGGESARHQR